MSSIAYEYNEGLLQKTKNIVKTENGAENEE